MRRITINEKEQTGFAALIGVYADEFKSMVMIGVIGRGMSWDKFVLAKFLDLCILVFVMQLMTIIYVLILKTVLGVTLNPIETGYLILSFVTKFIDIVGTVTLAAILVLVFSIVVYVGGAIALTMLIFRKKELEF